MLRKCKQWKRFGQDECKGRLPLVRETLSGQHLKGESITSEGW